MILELLSFLLLEEALFSVQFPQQGITIPVLHRLVIHLPHLCHQLGEGDLRIDSGRFHTGEGLQSLIEANRVEDLKKLLSHPLTGPGGPSQHLFIQDPGFDPAQEDQGADLGDIDPRRQQIHRHRHLGVGFILEAADRFQGVVDRAGDLQHRPFLFLLPLPQLFPQNLRHHVGVFVIGGEDQGFLSVFQVQVLGHFIEDRLIEGTGDNRLVELIHLDVRPRLPIGPSSPRSACPHHTPRRDSPTCQRMPSFARRVVTDAAGCGRPDNRPPPLPGRYSCRWDRRTSPLCARPGWRSIQS